MITPYKTPKIWRRMFQQLKNRMYPDGTWTTQYDPSIPPPHKNSKLLKSNSSESSSIQPTTLGFQGQDTFVQNTGPSNSSRQATGISPDAMSKEIYDTLESLAPDPSIDMLLKVKGQTGVPVLETLIYHDYAREKMNVGTRRRTT